MWDFVVSTGPYRTTGHVLPAMFRDPDKHRDQMFPAANLDKAFSDTVNRLCAEGKTVMFIKTRERVHGLIAVRDQVRLNTKGVIDQLHAMGIATIMLTGDNGITAKAVAADLGIDDIRADLKPEDNTVAIDALKDKYGAVVMVGDGINDAPALAKATVGVAMGTIGTDAAYSPLAS